jgi:type IV secretion system protein TrbJ
MKKVVFAGIAAISLIAGVPPVSAQLGGSVVYCTNCSTIAQQLADYARQLTQLQQEITTATQEINSALALPTTAYRDLTTDVRNIENIGSQAQMLSGQTGAMLNNLSNTGGYPLGNITSLSQELITESNAISNAIKTAANVFNRLGSSSDSATLSALQTQALGTAGRQATLQTLAGIETTLAQQISKQQATNMAIYQGLLTTAAADADRREASDALTTEQMAAGVKAECTAAGMALSWCLR